MGEGGPAERRGSLPSAVWQRCVFAMSGLRSLTGASTGKGQHGDPGLEGVVPPVRHQAVRRPPSSTPEGRSPVPGQSDAPWDITVLVHRDYTPWEKRLVPSHSFFLPRCPIQVFWRMVTC